MRLERCCTRFSVERASVCLWLSACTSAHANLSKNQSVGFPLRVFLCTPNAACPVSGCHGILDERRVLIGSRGSKLLLLMGTGLENPSQPRLSVIPALAQRLWRLFFF